MRAKELRAEVRVPVNRRGALNSGEAWSPCLIMDMSESGLLIMSNQEQPIGKVLEFRSELFPGKHLDCKIEVKHVNDTDLGTQIIDIDKNGMELCHLFLQEQFADKLTTFD